MVQSLRPILHWPALMAVMMLACEWNRPALAADAKVPISAVPHASAETVIAEPAVTATPSAPAAKNFRTKIEPILANYCYDCHGEGAKKGSVSLDDFASDSDLLAQPKLWTTALKNVRAGLMPPDDNPRPSAEEITQLENWVKYDALGINPADPDPGRVVVRRLNRVEYHNTIRDLMGVDFNATAEFPPDDTGDGFDNNGEVLTVSPLLLEKYLQAAETIVDQAIPRAARIVKTRSATGFEFKPIDGSKGSGERIDPDHATTVSHKFNLPQAETYRLSTNVEVRGSLVFDPRQFTLVCFVDRHELSREEMKWHDYKLYRFDREMPLTAGDHVVSFQIIPREPQVLASSPNNRPEEAPRLSARIASVRFDGPLPEKYWIPSPVYTYFFPDGAPPSDPVARDAYAHKVLRHFASRAFRRPVDEAKVNQLAGVARSAYEQPGQSFESGVAHAMMAVIASPRFLYRMDPRPAHAPSSGFSPIDEYALASRLSYFLWSSMPDDELYDLAARGVLRKNISAQVARMIKDKRSAGLVQNFTGQWLQARDVESVPISPREILGRKAATELLGKRGDFDPALREAMRRETEAGFDYILRDDRSVLELIDCDYVFINARLAKHYGLPDVTGEALRRVTLPPDSVRGGVLTSGTMLTITSNPTRTSPVKRGLFVLDNILGTPPLPPPANIPALEEAGKSIHGHEPTLRELLAEHRASPLCASCHERMDPLGLALENFTAIGTWRDLESGQPIASAGRLVTGETFTNVRELKHLLTHERRLDYYRCLTEKLMTYALGRGVVPGDLHTIDAIVAQLDATQGKFSVLLTGIIASPAFQKQRNASETPTTVTLVDPRDHP